MAQANDMFRKAALDRMTSPERLDEMMQITSRRGWLALTGLTGLLLGALVWGIFGSVPTTVSGQGLIIRQGGTYPVPALVTGEVTAIKVSVGEQIRANQIVAIVRPLAGGPPIQVKTLYTGRVLELGVDPGSVVQPGTPIVNVEESSKPLIAVLYLPSYLGKQIRIGMKAEISPVTVATQNFGYMVGSVSWVAPFPATLQAMNRLLANEALVQILAQASGGTPLEVDVALARDASTPSHFKWSSGKGPNTDITTGTLTSNQIVISQQHPLSFVLPGL